MQIASTIFAIFGAIAVFRIMDNTTKLSVLLILYGLCQAKDPLFIFVDLNPTISLQGYNATVCIDKLQLDLETPFEITFFSYTSKQNFTEVMLYRPANGQGHIFINRIYVGRIEIITMNNSRFSFMLMNVIFNDTGEYTFKENSVEKGKSIIFVARRLLVAQLSVPFTFSFIFHDTNTSSIKVYNPSSKLSEPLVTYYSNFGNCTYLDILSGEEKQIQTCVLGNGGFSFRIPKILWLHKGAYFACDDKDRHLDSIFVDIQETGNLIPSGNVNPLLYVMLGIGGIIISVLTYLRHKFTTRLRVDRMSNIDTLKDCKNDDEEENIQEENSLGRCLTVIRSEKGELSSAASELDFVEVIELPLFEENVVPATNELEHSVRLDIVQGSGVLDGYLNPVHSCPVEFDGYIHPVPSCSLEFDESNHPINSSPVNSGVVSTCQSTEV